RAAANNGRDRTVCCEHSGAGGQVLDWVNGLFSSPPLTAHGVVVGVALFAVTFVVSMALVAYFLIRLPSAYFQSGHEPRLDGRHRALRWCCAVAKNLAGVILVLLGIVLSVPGIPGQGILTLLVGFMLLDLPG